MAETILDLQEKITKLETELKEMYQEDERLCTIIGETKTQKASYMQLIKAVLDAVITQGIKVSSIDDVPVNVYLLDDTIYPLSFILDETDDLLTIAVTDPDGFERAKIIPKENLSSIEIIYQQDLEPIEETTTNEVMYN